MKGIATVFIAVLVVALIGCSPGAGREVTSGSTTVSASGTADRLNVRVSLPNSRLVAGTTAKSTISATNSTDSTVTTDATYYVVITSSSGETVFDTSRWKYLHFKTSVGPHASYVRRLPFTVPPVGAYTLSLPRVKGSNDQTLSVAFNSVAE